MSDKKKTVNEGLLTQKKGEAAKTRARHSRETMAKLGEIAQLSRETMRKFEKVEKEAPAALREAMGKTISIHKAAEINKYIQRMPEEEREGLAVWLILKAVEEKQSGVWREKMIANKLSAIMSIARKNSKYLNEECAEIFLKFNSVKVSEAIDFIDDEIHWLYVLKKVFQKIEIMEDGASKT